MKIRAIILVGAALFAGQAYGQDWKKNDLVLIDSTTRDGQEVAVVETEEGAQFSIVYSETLSQDALDRILRLHSNFIGWDSLTIESIKFKVVDAINIEVVIYPESYSIDGEEISQYLTGGMFFTLTDSLYYNFRILVDRILVEIKGLYVDENSFNEKLATAIDDPRTYINSRDPEFLLEKIDRLELNVKLLQKATIENMNRKPVDSALIDRVVQLKKEDPAHDSASIVKALAEEEIKASTSTVGIILKVYFNE